jgi:ADP-heptose:LPS heptosyltransferase
MRDIHGEESMTEHMLFPFHKIDKDSRIIIYGAGDMGGKILKFIKKTKFCEVICFLDKNFEFKKDFPFAVRPPEAVLEIADYSFVLISILLEGVADKAKNTLLDLGVPERKILFLNENHSLELPRFIINKPKYSTGIVGLPLAMAFVLSGGLGDELIASVLIKEIRKEAPANARIDCYSAFGSLFSLLPFIDQVYPLCLYDEANEYDAVFCVRRFVHFHKINLEKIKHYSPRLHDFCVDSINICGKVSGWVFNDHSYTDYCLIKGKNRMEQGNPHGILPYDRNSKLFLKWDAASFDLLTELGLHKNKYITICNNSGDKSANNSNKLWSPEYFDQLLALIKREHPELLIVWVGASYRFGMITNADIDLIGRTSLSELCVLLKHGALNIGVEGGVIHLRHFLNGRSACLFGSTDIRVYGYPENINIRSEFPENCSHGCEWVTQNWLDGDSCLISPNPACMDTLKPDKVYDLIAPALRDGAGYRYAIEKCVSPIGDADLRHLLGIGLRQKNKYSAALIERKGDDAIFQIKDALGDVIVFTEDLSIATGEFNACPANCLYAERAKANGMTAEYGFIYNIPARDDCFDLVFNFTLSEAAHPEFALREMLRVVAADGKLALHIEDLPGNYGKWREIFASCDIRSDIMGYGENAIFVVIRKYVGSAINVEF